MILVIGTHEDPHVDRVVRELHSRTFETRLIDPYSTTSDAINASMNGRLQLHAGFNRPIKNNISAIWWRLKPDFQMPNTNANDLYDYFFRHKEWAHFFDSVDWLYNECFWVNCRARSKKASNKLYQLNLAKDLNFDIPATVVTNNANVVVDFMDANRLAEVATKTLSPYCSPIGQIAYTSLLTKNEIQGNHESISTAPLIFQEFIKKDYELRITLVGDKIFPVKINSNKCVGTSIDWRRGVFSDIYDTIQLPESLENKIRLLHKELSLEYAAYDFIVHKDVYYFIEVNPSGQWLWLEDALNLPISSAVADILSDNGPTRRCT